ncbi:MAG: imidazolonepropionase [Flavobacteriales bacterium]|nr:imidazolonepropionase [Flavobacteriales bacterium]
MHPKIYTQIKHLYGITQKGEIIKKGEQLKEFKSISDAWLTVNEKGYISGFGTMDNLPESNFEEINCMNKMVLPAFIDSHTHLIHAKSREDEFVARIKGMSYEEIANMGGGILNSAKALNECSEDELFRSSFIRLQRAIESGTGGIEIKSGYGLTVSGELKMLRVAQRLKSVSPIPVKVTFLGAHAFPGTGTEIQETYISEIIDEMLPVIGKEGLADYIDVFCEKNYFSVEQMERILDAGARYNLKPKVHVNQFNAIGGVQSAVNKNAVSVDHLELLEDGDIKALKNSETIPVALPACSFFLNIPYTPSERILKNNLALALATDYNPGSSPCLSMPFVVSLACIYMKMLPEEAFNAATLNGAAALQISDSYGSIEVGKKGNFILTKSLSSINYLPYSFTENWIEKMVLS